MNCANHLDREKTAFCQNCGKPLCPECTRKIGDAVFCEPCLAAKLAGAQAGNPAVPPPAYTYPGPAAAAYTAGIVPPPHGAPRPILAGFLGFIPGVGAMYNEQYVKAGVHLIVFVILVSLANQADAFGFFVAGWEFYMAFEAYHTARCRRDGLPLPNPFGLNDLGHKLGLDKTSFQGGTAPAAPVAPPLDPYATAYGPIPTPVPPAAGYPPPYPPAAVAPPPSWAATPAWEQYNQPGWQYDPAAAPIPPAGVPLDTRVPYPGNRFPAGAIWLIGLGALFLLFNAGMIHGITIHLFVPTLLIGLAVFIFIRKLNDYGYGLTSDGSVEYRIRVFRALRSSVWLALVGLLFFLNEFTPLHWGRSWPLFIILAGVMTVLQRVVYSGVAPVPPPYIPGYGYPPQPPAPSPVAAPVPVSVPVPVPTHEVPGSDQEGS